MGSKKSLSLLGRLRTAINKVKILLNLDMHRWRFASMIGARSQKHQLSFNDRPGLRACCEAEDDKIEDCSVSSKGLQRTVSYPSEDDIDKRAEMFISNFRKQLQIERQISLELYYQKGSDSFKSARGDSFKSSGGSFELEYSP